MVGKGGLEPPRLAARGPKPRPSANSGTPPNLVTKANQRQKGLDKVRI